MAITPSSHLKLLKCEIELDNKNQLTFANATAQYNYFNGLNKLEVDNFTYLRKDSVIRYNAHIDSIIQYNYVMYQNTNYSNKWFYAFITHMEYVSDTVTLIYIETDYFQTWQFDLTYKQCFVEREHVADDTVGKHLVDEGLELGEFVTNGDPTHCTDLESTMVVLCVSTLSNGDYQSPTQKGRLVDGLSYYLYNIDEPTTGQTQLGQLTSRLGQYASNGYLSNIVALCNMPLVCWPYGQAQTSEFLTNQLQALTTTLTMTRNTTIDGYTPKNKKLLTSPFNFILADNNSGGMAKYSYEFFKTPASPEFRIKIVPSIGCSVMLYPFEYKNITSSANYNEGLAGGKFSTNAWSGDAYTNWLSQNGLNNAINIATSLGEIAVGTVAVASGAGALAGASLIASGAGGVMNTIQQVHQAKYIPAQVDANTSSGDVPNAFGYNTFYLYKMSITKEKAQIIDGYFNMYGYKVSTLKTPALSSRSNWNYVKTIDANIEGYIPQDDMQKIKDMFNSGITLWHTTQYFLDYSRTNSIVS